MPSTFGNFCNGCPYERSRIGKEPLSKEHNGSSTLLVFQSPGIDEWNLGKPVCSSNARSTAARVRNSLTRISKSRVDFDITNAVQCFPGKAKSGRDNKPSEVARRLCEEWLRVDIDSSNYSKIVVFGAIAKRSVNSVLSVSTIPVVFIAHPSGQLSNADLDDALS